MFDVCLVWSSTDLLYVQNLPLQRNFGLRLGSMRMMMLYGEEFHVNIISFWLTLSCICYVHRIGLIESELSSHYVIIHWNYPPYSSSHESFTTMNMIVDTRNWHLRLPQSHSVPSETGDTAPASSEGASSEIRRSDGSDKDGRKVQPKRKDRWVGRQQNRNWKTQKAGLETPSGFVQRSQKNRRQIDDNDNVRDRRDRSKQIRTDRVQNRVQDVDAVAPSVQAKTATSRRCLNYAKGRKAPGDSSF